MSLPSSVIDAMLAAGCSVEQLAAAVKAANAEHEEIQAEKRAKAAAKKRRQRHSVPGTLGDTGGQTGTEGDNPSPKKETSPTPPKEKTTPSQSEPNGSSKNPRQALEMVLDAEHATSVIEHRQRLRKPLTLKAAELLAGQFAKCADPNAGADAMVLNGWQGFNPDWMDRQQVRGSPPRQPATGSHHFTRLAEEMSDEPERTFGSDQGDRHDARGVPILTISDYRRHG